MAQRLENPSSSSTVLSSDWGGSPGNPSLSRHLIASFYQVTKDSQGAWQPASGPTVKAPLTEASMEIALNWKSPFEDTGADSGMPTVAAMLQSGAIQPFLNMTGAGDGKAASMAKAFEGRTGITKMNSTQVFSGMPPVKIQVTALFRAWLDTEKEVEGPTSQLMAWALPQELAADGAILSFIKAIKDQSSVTAALMPSIAPVMVAMEYKGRTYSPLVIESIGYPLNSPVDAFGRYTELLIPMTLCTLTAFDRKDWVNSRQL